MDEYISRNSLLRKLSNFNWAFMMRRPELYEEVAQHLIRFFGEKVQEEPAANVVPVDSGKWINLSPNPEDFVKAQCPLCKRVSFKPMGRFCRWCGAAMALPDDIKLVVLDKIGEQHGYTG